MVISDLNGKWQLRERESGELTPANVPGSVYQDLLAAGKTEDAYLYGNETLVQDVFKKDYEYIRTFELKDDMLLHERLVLSCKGLDTLATIIVNNRELGKTNNMHRDWEFDLKGILVPGTNEIRILFKSPVKYAEEKPSMITLMAHPVSLRKASCMFGWDWGLSLPDMGIWRSISVDAYDTGRISDVLIEQIHSSNGVTLKIDAQTMLWDQDVNLEVIIEDPNGKKVLEHTSTAQILQQIISEITNPELWWPVGQGDQPLYTMRIRLFNEFKTVDERELSIGLRTIKLLREEDEYGLSYTFEVNGRKIFAKGANLIIEDAVLGRRSEDRTKKMIKDCVAANFNCIRVWGGANYPEKYFYDYCDKYGILVYQDFMFACNLYPADDEFVQNITDEAILAIKKLRNHACLALWSGNNEVEAIYALLSNKAPEYSEMLKQFGIDEIPQQLLDLYKYNSTKLFYEVLPELVKQYDPQTNYVASSPSSDEPFVMGSFDEIPRGDFHYYLVYDQLRPYPNVRDLRFRFVSEMGFQSYPDWKTILSFTDEDDRGPYTPVMLQHQKCHNGNQSIEHYISADYNVPTDFRSYVYASQLMAGQIMGYTVEHFRRLTGLCMGMIVWQLNDCWPAVSWAGIDYYGRWKAQQYYLKRAFAPVLISALDEGLSVKLFVNNDSPTSLNTVVKWALYNKSFTAIAEGEKAVSVNPQGVESIQLPDLSSFIAEHQKHEYVLSFTASEKANVLSSGNLLFVKPKDFSFEKPELEINVKDSQDMFVIDITSSVFVRGLELSLSGVDAVFSDNYFDLLPGEHKLVEIEKNGLSAPVSAEEIKAQLEWKSAYDLQKEDVR